MTFSFSITRNQLEKYISQMQGKSVLIIGDVGVDEYVLGGVKRISPEAPVPVLEVDQEEARLGLSANVAQNVASLGGTPLLLSVVGQDSGADTLANLLRDNSVSPDHLVVDKSRPTTRKMRVMAQHHHLVRVDFEHRKFIEESIQDELLKKYESLLAQADIVVLQDYAKGVVTERVARGVIEKAHAQNKMVLVDPHRSSPLSLYEGADLMTPNHDESLVLAGWVLDDLREDPDYVDKVAGKILEQIKGQNVVITLGSKGMKLFEGKNTHHLPTFARQVFDVTGAGDTVIASLALAWASGLSLQDSCIMSNLAAGVVVGKVGCVPCPADELVSYYDRISEFTKK